MSDKKLRQYKKIPIFIVENHNEVLEFIYRSLASRHLPFQNNKIVHFDSHPDMTISNSMPASMVYDKENLLNAVSIESWLMPTVYAGHFSDLIWIKPEWATQMPNGEHDFSIGDYNGAICVNSRLEYFISEGSYRPKCDLNNEKSVKLNVFTLNENIHDATNDRCDFIDKHESYVLDIDLDFFSTHNPFKHIFGRGTIFEDLRTIYRYRLCDENASDNEFLECTIKRLEQLNNLERFFKHLDVHGDLTAFDWPNGLLSVRENLLKLVENIRELYKEEDVDWKLVNDAGCTFDSSDLPHHESTMEEIQNLLKCFKTFLRQLNKSPTIITISRSSEDDYCPPHQVDEIQTLVLNALTDVYGMELDDTPILRYLNDEWRI